MDEPIASPSPGTSPPPAPAIPTKPLGSWRGVRERESADRRRASAVMALLAALTVVLIVTTFNWFSPVERPVLIVLGDSSRLAPVPYGEEDRRAMAGLVGFVPVASTPTIDEGIAAIDADENLGTLLVYVCSRAWVVPSAVEPETKTLRFARDGTLPAPGRPADGALLADLLGPIQAHKAARKLLILDIHPPPDDPRLGVVNDDLATVVASESRQAVEADPRLSVLTSCEPGQHPRVSEALARSAFGYFVEQGLRGDADLSGDGRVSVRELSSFVRLRVDRWTRRVLDARQTPGLLESPIRTDFPIALVDRRSPRPPALAKEVPPYPAWLLDTWRDRDAQRKLGGVRDAPRVFGQLEAALLLAERSWRERLDEAQVRSELANRTGLLRDRFSTLRAIPHPRPRSLALELALGATPDPELLEAVRGIAIKRATPPPANPDGKPLDERTINARLIVEFAGSAKVRSPFDLADAVFRVASEDPAPTRGSIVFLDQLLGSRQPSPSYVETLALRRLAEAPSAARDPETLRLALALTRRGETVQARPNALFLSAKALDEADRLRHEAEVLLASPDYAARGEVNRRLIEALTANDAVEAGTSTIDEAHRLLDEAMAILPASTPLLPLDADLERGWFTAVEAARGLAQIMDLAPSEDSPRAIERILKQIETVRGSLGPFGPEAIAGRVQRLTQPTSNLGSAALREINALLATPLPLAGQRPALWNVGIALERRLVEASLPLEGRDDPIETPRLNLASIEGLAEGLKSRRERVSDAVLALVGPEGVHWAGLVDVASNRSRQATERDRAGRLVSPWVDSPTLDEPASNPSRQLRIERFQKLRQWLKDRYAFEGRDPVASDFFQEAARGFAEPGDPASASLAIEADPPEASLRPDRPEATVRLRFRREGPSIVGALETTAWVEVSLPDRLWLDIQVGEAGSSLSSRHQVDLDSGPVGFPLKLSLRPESEPTDAPIPPGLLVRVRWNGRTYHRRIPLRIEPESKQPRLILVAGPSPTGPSVSEIRLRAVRGKTPYSLHLRNPGDRDRRFLVELSDLRGAISGSKASLTVKAGETSPVVFGPPPSNPEASVVDLVGPLSVRLDDRDDPTFRLVRTIPVELANPSDYVRVVGARYDPPGSAVGDKDRLSFRLRAVGRIDGPPCPVELSLPSDRIPGLLSVGEGIYRNTLEKLGDELTLFAEGLEFDPRAAEESGYVHLAVDGVERALVYRVRFARRGIATIPWPDGRPAVRLKAGPAALSSAPLRFEVDVDAPPPGGRLELTLGQYTASPLGESFRADSVVQSDPERGQVRLNPRGPEGSLVFEATVRAPSITFDAGKVRGRRIIRARLLDERQTVKASDERPLVIDDRGPTAVGFESPPRYGLRSGSVALKATGKVPDSGIKEVVFFAGRPQDGKRPAGVTVIPGQSAGLSREAWTAALPLSDAKLGPLDVSVEFVPGVGPSRFDTATISVVEAIPIEPGTIRGSVQAGKRPQPGLEVRLYDEKGAEKGKTTTDESGKFEFAKLVSGAYEVVSALATPPTRGSAKVEVKAGATTEVEVPLFRTP